MECNARYISESTETLLSGCWSNLVKKIVWLYEFPCNLYLCCATDCMDQGLCAVGAPVKEV